jgi:SAM-dependent methyltransferase
MRADPPGQLKKWLQDIREQEAAITIASLIGERRIVLNIGPSWGRDYYSLTQQGKQVVNADIAPQRHLESLVLCDVTRGLPFGKQRFEAVLMPEVLEHLIEDAVALVEVRRVLRDDGLLIVSVPFYSDEAEFHVRIHSPRSIQRLLHSAGFDVVVFIERGGLVSAPRLVHAARRICRPFINPDRFNQLVVRFDHFLARRFTWLLKRSRGYGCYLAAQKSSTLDFRRLNVEEFRH